MSNCAYQFGGWIAIHYHIPEDTLGQEQLSSNKALTISQVIKDVCLLGAHSPVRFGVVTIRWCI